MNRRDFIRLCLSSGVGVAAATFGRAQAQTPLAETSPEALAAQALLAFAPYLQQTGPQTAVVRWRTTAVATAFVRWTQAEGAAPEAWQVSVAAQDGLIAANRCDHCVPLQGVDPTKPLFVEVFSAPISAFAPYNIQMGEALLMGRLTLAPWWRGTLDSAVESDGLDLAIFNDLHGQTHLIPKLLAKLEPGVTPSVALFNGDCADDCQTQAGLEQRFLHALPPLMARGMRALFLRGNHECRGAMARRIRENLSPLAEGRFYGAFSIGPVRLLFIDSGEDKPDDHPVYGGLLACEAYLDEQAAWLREEVASSAWQAARFRFAFMHMPPHSPKADRDAWRGPTRLREKIAPVLENAKLDLMICGHNHSFAYTPVAGVHFPYQIVIGGGPSEESATLLRLQVNGQRWLLTPYRLTSRRAETIGSMKPA